MRVQRLAFLVALMLLPTALPALAQGGEASTPPPPRSVWTVFNTVQVAIEDNYAVAKVIADIGNRGPDPEFPFVVRVPEDAFVTGLSITRDGQLYEARVEDREAARQEYEQHKSQQMTGGLVEKRRGSSTYAFLVNVAEFESVRAVLTYERYLAADEGAYHLDLEAPVSGFGQDLGAAFDVQVQHSDGVLDAWGSAGSVQRDGAGWRLTHRVGPRGNEAAPTAFTANYVLQATDDAGSLVVSVRDGLGYFAHRFRAPADAVQLPIDLVLVLDTSGSMQGLKLQQMRDAATQMVARLRSDDRLHLVFFSSDAHSPWDGLRDATPAQRTEAAGEIDAALAQGATNIEDGVKQGFGAFSGIDWSREEGRLPLLVFLTDGMPTAGLQDRTALRQAARAANGHGIPVFALAFGRDADWGLVQGLAKDGNGTALRVPDGAGAEVDLRRFLGALTTPVLRDVVLRYEGAVTAHLQGAAILFAGSELLAVGTFPPEMQVLKGTVRALAPDGVRRYNVSEPVAEAGQASFLPRLWAYQEIRRLQALIDAEGTRREWVQGIKALALKHGFVTDHTSLVVTLAARQVTCVDDCMMRPTAAGGPAGAPASCCPPTPTTPPGAPPPSSPPPTWESSRTTSSVTTDADGRSSPWPGPAPATPAPASPPVEPLAEKQSSTDAAWNDYEREVASTPGFEGVLALAALGLALLAFRRRA